MPGTSSGTGATAVYLDACPVLHDAVARLLQRIDIRLVAATGSPDQALALVRLHRPELFLLELDASGSDSLDSRECLRLACAEDPGLTAVVISAEASAGAAFELGATAHVHKSAPPVAIEEAISSALERCRCGEPPASVLTRREREIVELVSDGRTNAEVARVLWLSCDTVKFHLANVFRKLHVCSRSEVARWARAHGLSSAPVGEIEPPPVPRWQAAPSHAPGQRDREAGPSRRPPARRGARRRGSLWRYE